MEQKAARIRRLLNHVVTMACATGMVLPAAPVLSAPIEPPIVPTVHPVLAPSSAIHLPLIIRAAETYVWRTNSEQRVYASGSVAVQVGYRTLHANKAAIFLTPTKDAGESTFDVAIYLSEAVRIDEGHGPASTATTTDELLVTTRISGSIHIGGGNPKPQKMDDNAVVRRGDTMRTDLLTKPAPLVYIPTITITSTELALQRGWIARGPGNRIIAGPAEGLAANAAGGASTAPAAEAKVPPQIFATADHPEYNKVVGNERVHMMRGAFYLRITEPGRPAFELHAERAVLFAPKEAQSKGENTLAQVTGVYLEGDVSLDYGSYAMRAERLYYDFLSNRVIILDGMLSTEDEVRNVPMVLRAEEIRGYNIRNKAAAEFAAKSVKFSTSEFYMPHYHIGASNAYLQPVQVAGGAVPNDREETPKQTYAYQVSDVTMNFAGVPIFWWPYLSGDTSKMMIPLRKINVGYTKRYGLSIETSWHLLALAGIREPEGVRSILYADYFGKRGPGTGADVSYDNRNDVMGRLRTYIIDDDGKDDLARDRDGIDPQDKIRGRAQWQHKTQLDENWSLQVEAAYISDPNFVEEFYPSDFLTDNEPETSIYLKRQEDTQALSILGKWSLYDFTSVANRVDDQFTTEKSPEIKYYRIGDNLFDLFTYYSESGVANVAMNFTDYDPKTSGLGSYFPTGATISSFYKDRGWTGQNVFRTDTRHELDMPLHLGPLTLTPYVSGRFSSWNEDFPNTANDGSTERVWGTAGVRGSTTFWRVYDDVNSEFWDIHRIRHVVEPQFQAYAADANYRASDLQPFDPDVEEISSASGASFNLHQKWQTKRGGPGHWRMVDYFVLNIGYTGFWNNDQTGPYAYRSGDVMYNNRRYLVYNPLRGFMFTSRPELSQIANSFNTDATWRVGEWIRLVAEASYNTDTGKVHEVATGVVVDHTQDLSYFIGNRFVTDETLDGSANVTSYNSTDEWTFATHYQISRKYSIALAQSYDFELKRNILSSGTLMRRFPRMTTAITVGYDANTGDTSFIFTAWPEGFESIRLGSSGGTNPFGDK